MNEFTVPEFDASGLTIPDNFNRLNSKQRNFVRNTIKANLTEACAGRDTVVIGVTETIPFRDGTAAGSLTPVHAYNIAWFEFAALKLDPARSSKVLLLDPSIMKVSMMHAIKQVAAGRT
jgi:hypothetical protein